MSDIVNINKEAPIRIKHLWGLILFIPTLMGGLGWYLDDKINKATEPLQTKVEFVAAQKETKTEWNNWLKDEWKPHEKEANESKTFIGILIDRTDSRATNTNSVGTNGMTSAPPPH